MTIIEYEIISESEQPCCECGCYSDIIMDDDGDFICTDCLFEKITEE